MHRFQFHRKHPAPNHTYALMNGIYYGGSADKSDIILDLQIPFIPKAKIFRLVVSDDCVKLSTIRDSSIKIQINGTKQETSLTDFIIEHGDSIGIGCSVFELIKHEPAISRSDFVSSKNPCGHPYNPMDERKCISRIDCPYPKCLFACWCIADLNEHVVDDDGHKGQILADSEPIVTYY